MGAESRPEVLNDYARKVIRIKARQLAQRRELGGCDRDDIEQELTLELLKQAHHFDIRRASLNTFVARVIDTAVAMLLRARRARKRAGESTTRPLSDQELHARTAELGRISHSSLPWRALQYLLDCWAYQTFWAAFVVYAPSAGVADPPAWICSAAAYSSAAVLLSSLHHRFPPPMTDGPPSGRPSCKGCGK